MREHLQSFLDYLRYNRNASSHTVAAYRGDLSQFLTFLETRVGRRTVRPDDLDHHHVRAFLAEGMNFYRIEKDLAFPRRAKRKLTSADWFGVFPHFLEQFAQGAFRTMQW